MTVIWLADKRCQVTSLAGNKGAFLARLVDAGYRVPPGFVISADTFDDSRHLGTDSWQDDVRASLEKLSPPWVARSSSTAEDSTALSFAGLFTTFLGLASFDTLIAAVNRIVVNTNTETSERYARHHGIDPSQIKMAVVVQTLVLAASAGVAFSRHPVTGANNVTIEATYGLGDSLVDGSISPDHLEVSEDGRVEIIRVGTKKVKSSFLMGRVTRQQTTDAERGQLALSLEAARNIAALVRKIEKEFGKPQDVEWAINGENDIYVLQARPITRLSIDI